MARPSSARRPARSRVPSGRVPSNRVSADALALAACSGNVNLADTARDAFTTAMSAGFVVGA